MYYFHTLPIAALSLCLSLLITFCKGSTAHDVRQPYHFHRRSLNTSSSLPVIGIPVNGIGPVPQRLEIRQLQQNPYQWNSYLLALSKFQGMNQSIVSSYYQIAGIHGRPFIPWDNAQFAANGTGGYCTHSSTLFPTWHRPYVAVFEQILHSIVQDIAESFSGSNQSDYITAAATFRVPYWDWAAPAPIGQDTLPSSISSPAPVQVITPNGTQTIPNPLYQYHFNPLDSNQLPDFPVCVSCPRSILELYDSNLQV